MKAVVTARPPAADRGIPGCVYNIQGAIIVSMSEESAGVRRRW